MAQGRRASGSPLRRKIEEQHREVLARGFHEEGSQVKDAALLHRYQELVDRLLAAGDNVGGTESASPAGAGDGQELVIFRRLAEASGYGFCVADLKGGITYANRALCRLLAKHDPTELIGTQLTACYPEEVREQFAAGIIPSVVKNGQWVGELPLRSAAGQRTPTLQIIFMVHADPGAGPYLANLILDITDRKRAEEALRKSEERYRMLVENLRDAVFMFDLRGTITFVSGAAQALSGFSPEQIVGRSIREFILQDDRERSDRHFAALAVGTAAEEIELRILTKGVEVRWLRVSARPIRQDGAVVGLHGVATDITDRKRAEQALHASEAKFSQAFQLSPHGMLIFRPEDGEILDVNRRFLRITGYTPQEVIGRSLRLFEYWVRPWSRDAFQRALGESGQAESAEVALRTSDGRILPVQFAARAIELGGAPCAIGVVRDVSERQRAEVIMRRMRDLGQELRAARDLEDALRLCLSAALAVSGMDGGACYRCDPAAGGLELVCSDGLSPDAAARLRRIDADSEWMRLIEAGPAYHAPIPADGIDPEAMPRAIVLLPVMSEGRLAGALYLRSLLRAELPEKLSEALEPVVERIEAVVARAETAQTLRQGVVAQRLLLGAIAEAVARHRLICAAGGEPIDYEVIEVNPAFERLLERSREDLIGRRSREVYGGEVPFELERFGHVALSQEPASFVADCVGCRRTLKIRAFAPCRGQVTLVIDPEEWERAAP